MRDSEASARVLDAARAGQAWAFTVLWTELSPAVAAYARAQGSREPDDLTSDVFLAAFTRLSTFTGDTAAFRAFVFTIAHHRVVDERRRRSRRPEALPLEPGDDAGREVSAEETVLQQVATERTVAMLADLSDDQREVLLLRLVADLTVTQVAALTGRRPGAVKALQRRGLDALRRRMGDGRVPLQRGQAIAGVR